MKFFSHLDKSGKPKMVNVLSKPEQRRTAKAEAFLKMSPSTIRLLKQKALPKGDALTVAQIAGIQAAKRTGDLIPLCHSMPQTIVEVEFEIEKFGVRIITRVEVIAVTGPELEALVAVTTAALALYDMAKAVDKTMQIQHVRLLEKSGGRSELKNLKVGVNKTVAVMVLSDRASKGVYSDESGKLAAQMLKQAGFKTVPVRVLPDEKEQIVKELLHWCDEAKVDLLITSGGTGLSPRDVTPEATAMVIKKEVPGIPEAFRTRFQGYRPTTGLLSRAKAGVRGRTLIVNLPGRPKAVKECLEVLIPCLPHTFDMMVGEGHEKKK